MCSSDLSAFGSAKELHSETILLADLVVGRKLSYNILPTRIRERYLRVRYVVVGTAPTVGQVFAGIVADVDGSLGSDE